MHVHYTSSLRTVYLCVCTTHHPCALPMHVCALHIILAHCQYMCLQCTSSLRTANMFHAYALHIILAHCHYMCVHCTSSLRTANACVCTTHHPCALPIYAYAPHIILVHCQYMCVHCTSSLRTANTCVPYCVCVHGSGAEQGRRGDAARTHITVATKWAYTTMIYTFLSLFSLPFPI